MLNPFHLAIEVHDLNAAREFYVNILKCKEGRSDTLWIDFNFYGHQLVCHLNKKMKIADTSNNVDGNEIPIPHFGVVLNMSDWNIIADQLVSFNIDFIVEPYIRFKGLPGEQATMFFCDPSGNSIELKAFKDIKRQLFKK